MKTREIIEDVSFERFIKELVGAVKSHPRCELEGCDCGDDKRAENAFMFRAVIEYEEE